MRLLFVLLAWLALPAVVHAQGEVALDTLRSDQYDDVAARLRSGDLDVDFGTARLAYALTDGYEPYDVESRKRAQRMQGHLAAEDPGAALLVADSSLAVSYVDLDAHYLAGVAHDQLGEAERSAFHFSVFSGLLDSIFDPSRGTQDDPFVVINVSEEYVVAGVLGLQTRGQGLVSCGGVACDQLTLYDPEDGAEVTLYFDVSIPYGHMRRQLEGR